MENASQALLMAAGVLIGLLVLSLGVYLFANFGAASAGVHEQNRINQINQFNAQFTSFEGKDCTIYDIVTAVNLAIDNNTNYELTSESENNNYISVNAQGIGSNLQNNWLDHITGKIDNKKVTQVIQANNEPVAVSITKTDGTTDTNYVLKHYSCSVSINNITKRVQKVNFVEN